MLNIEEGRKLLLDLGFVNDEPTERSQYLQYRRKLSQYGGNDVIIVVNPHTISLTYHMDDVMIDKTRQAPKDTADMLRDINTFMYLLETMGASDYGKLNERGLL